MSLVSATCPRFSRFSIGSLATLSLLLITLQTSRTLALQFFLNKALADSCLSNLRENFRHHKGEQKHRCLLGRLGHLTQNAEKGSILTWKP